GGRARAAPAGAGGLRGPREAPARAPGMRQGKARALAAAAVLLLAALALGFLAGGVRLSLPDLLSGRGDAGETARMVASLRLPRVLLAALVGACLALAGAALQALLKNPLADPFLLGTSGGAATGAALAVMAGLSPLLLPAAALPGAVPASVGGGA